MNHGVATARREISFLNEKFAWSYFTALPPPPKTLGPGTRGIITAYLPEYEKFAVSLENGAWITFSVTEEEFKDIFDVELNKEKK